MNKEVFMYASLTLTEQMKEYIEFLSTRKQMDFGEMLIESSYIPEETYDAVIRAVDDCLSVMSVIEQDTTGDTQGHRLRMKLVSEIKSIMHIARAFPDKAIKRLKELPQKRLLNV